MKKNLLFAIAVLPFFAACSSETVDTPSNDNMVIGFENPFINKTTKSTGNDLTNTNLNSFNVYGYVNDVAGVLFNNQEVTGSKGDAVWTYSPLKYWVPGGNYSFTALAKNGNQAMTFTKGTSFDGAGTITFTSDGDTDIAYDYQKVENAVPATQGIVGFTFKHLLSRIKLSVRNTTAETEHITYKVTNAKITNAISSGSCALSNNTDASVWTKTGETTHELSFGDVNGGNAIEADGKTYDTANHKFILALDKAQYTGLTVTGTVEVIEENQTIETVTINTTIAGFDFAPGFSYNFIAELGNDNMGLKPIQFTLTSVEEFKDWTGGWGTTDQVTYTANTGN